MVCMEQNLQPVSSVSFICIAIKLILRMNYVLISIVMCLLQQPDYSFIYADMLKCTTGNDLAYPLGTFQFSPMVVFLFVTL